MANKLIKLADLTESDAADGATFIEQATPLTRLHYFDGQFLRATSLTLEQDYHRYEARLTNLAGGWGVVNGFGIGLNGSELDVSAGFAVTAAGNFVLGSGDLHANIEELLKTAAPPPPVGTASFADCVKPQAAADRQGLGIYEITVGPVEAQCGNEPVYGKLCESACASDSRHPYWREGVVLRLRPVTLQLPTSTAVTAALAHLRNRIASAYFRYEPWLTKSLVSGAGLASNIWCQPASLYGRNEVVIGLLARDGAVIRVIDAWSGRRERMDTQPRGYWQGRMSMRPWNVFIAQILQFQCQLSGLFTPGKPILPDDCDRLRSLLASTRSDLQTMLARYSDSSKKILLRMNAAPPADTVELQSAATDMANSFSSLDSMAAKLADAQLGQGALPQNRMLLNAGFFELPPAGYLPVQPGDDVEDQCRRMFGEGVNLQFHAVREDEIAHFLEEAQHMERISLTRGLDNPKNLEQVEIFLPDGGTRSAAAAPPAGIWWQADISPLAPVVALMSDTGAANSTLLAGLANIPRYRGLMRTESRGDGSSGFALAMDEPSYQLNNSSIPSSTIYYAADIGADPFSLAVGAKTTVSLEQHTVKGDNSEETSNTSGTLTVLQDLSGTNGLKQRLVQIEGETTASSNTAQSIQVILWRQDDATTRRLLVQIARNSTGNSSGPANSKSSWIEFAWSGSPLRATISVNTQAAGQPAANFALFAPAASANPVGTSTPVGTMEALPAMPDPAAAIAVTAMTDLTVIGKVSTDTAFLSRARQRLFPTSVQTQTQSTQALLDWVMFRRARTCLCGPAKPAPVPVKVTDYQVWHIKLANADELKLFTARIDKGGQSITDDRLTRVGVLHYDDDGIAPEESADQVRTMWTQVHPAALAALARVWRSDPSATPGAQDLPRLSNMLALTGSQLVSGASVVKSVPTPGQPPGDPAFAGGMLVVTMDKPQTLHPHRVVMLPVNTYNLVLNAFRTSGIVKGWQFLRDEIIRSGNKAIDMIVQYDSAGQMNAADATALKAADGKMRMPPVQIGYTVLMLRLDASPMDPAINALAEHKDIGAHIGFDSSQWGQPAGNSGVQLDSGVQTITLSSIGAADLGSGAQVVSVVGYLEVVLL